MGGWVYVGIIKFINKNLLVIIKSYEFMENKICHSTMPFYEILYCFAVVMVVGWIVFVN